VISQRKREVLLEVAHGRSNGQIVRRLFIEEATVKSPSPASCSSSACTAAFRP
jgi:FixJ family two-component response regulator